MKALQDIETRVREARARASQLAATLLAETSGPTMALLVLNVARTEVLELARAHVPAAEWHAFVEAQKRVEDAACSVLRAMGRPSIG